MLALRRSLALPLLLGLGLLPALPARAWDSAKPPADAATEARGLPAFQRIRLELAADLEVEEGPAQSVEVRASRATLPKVATEVKGDTLVIDSQGSRWTQSDPWVRIRITVPVLRAVDVRGSGDVRVAGASQPRDVELSVAGSGDLAWKGQAGKLEVSVSGSGDVRLEGRAERLEVAISGSGDLSARGLKAGAAEVAVSGSADAELTLDGGPLEVAVSGSGDVTWYGKASGVSTRVSGSGEVVHRE